jgi:hypothetical protein
LYPVKLGPTAPCRALATIASPPFSADLRNELAFFLDDFLQTANKTQISRNKF